MLLSDITAMRTKNKTITALAAACVFAACVMVFTTLKINANNTTAMQQQDKAQASNLAGCTKVLLETTCGNIEVVLYNETPKHRDNFVKLVKEGYYDGVLFHRVIKDFMIQTGDPDSKNATPDQLLGAGGPSYDIDAEFVYPKYYHKRGALAAARQGDETNPERKSSGSQFYIVTGRRFTPGQLQAMEQRMAEQQKAHAFQQLAMARQQQIMELQARGDSVALMNLQQQLIKIVEDTYAQNPVKLTQEQINDYTTLGGAPHLDGQYTVFGEVISGLDVVEKIENVETGSNDRPVNAVKIIKATIIE